MRYEKNSLEVRRKKKSLTVTHQATEVTPDTETHPRPTVWKGSAERPSVQLVVRSRPPLTSWQQVLSWLHVAPRWTSQKLLSDVKNIAFLQTYLLHREQLPSPKEEKKKKVTTRHAEKVQLECWYGRKEKLCLRETADKTPACFPSFVSHKCTTYK